MIDRLSATLSDRYRIERELGAGGMATVYLAHDLKHGRPVAIKVLHPDLAATLGAERFLREIRVTAVLQHPNILTLIDSGEADGLLYYVMPYVDGESLRGRLEREQQLPVAEALWIAKEVASALDAAHRTGVIHRDIKPENILLARENGPAPPDAAHTRARTGRVLVADFGIAQTVDDATQRLTSTGVTVGTAAYMSPEQATGERTIDARSDIYSLGCVLYEMLAGEPPFTGPNPRAVLSKQLTDSVRPVRRMRDAVPAAVDEVLVKSLARAPADRFSSASAFAAALDAASSGAVPIASRRRLMRRVGIGVLAVGALVAVVSIAISGGRAFERRESGDRVHSGLPRVAVLDLDVVGPDTLESYLATGLAEEITSTLSRFDRIQMKSRGAVRSIRSSGVADPTQLGARLRVDYLVEGSIRRVGGRLKVAVRLTKAADGFQLWGNDFDAGVQELPELHGRIATEVASRIGGQLSPTELSAMRRPLTTDAEAFEHYLRGNYLLARRTPLSVEQAIDHFQLAVARDSGFAAARARIAYAYSVIADWGWKYRTTSREKLISDGLKLVKEALAHDSLSADAWMARAFLLGLQDPVRLSGALEAFERAIALEPRNPEAHYQYGQALMILGRWPQAHDAYLRTIALDPTLSQTLVSTASIAWKLKRIDEARRWYDSALALNPSSSYAHSARAVFRLAQGDVRGGLEDAETAVRVEEGYSIPPHSVLAVALARSGGEERERANAEISRALSAVVDPKAPSPTDTRFIASALVALGRVNEALDFIERARPRGAWLWFYCLAADFDPIRSHPRFVRVMQDAKR